jgi:RNase H-fold protein (predicted Holliday junction resolvase)
VRALGIDYGERRIGLALSDATGLLASPWKRLDNAADVGAAARRLATEIHALQ